MRKDLYQVLGFARKAGLVSAGTMAAKTSLLRRRAHLLIMSGDISPRTRESLVSACEKYHVPWRVVGDKYRLGASVGKAYRVAVTVNDKGFAQTILELIDAEGNEANFTGVVEWRK
ncbi:MAG TPA: hypothetical protein GXX39_07410 [Syntrophothermus lipocalidus]|uniref:Ribosomal protein L7Ae/L30e/S12e/Gadd45 n=1 Tax=Syntrophothermus lipocalidus (strain DSM 12680 / TGB-C1) TaxID=643648 RepID=D7CM46_SYNLT|nr:MULTISPECIES: ribosomal L7Ae/L30e/S12e/Gadd45 family protein [Syntrophothermus]ADI01781.1 ribosomal protein L7Ae/L30e/S12e/Gadd45 [Syntrophothermus lipocalidus DSM 12680]NSW83652.1 ribosomal L7Ae/L30e/S12e/Gadd45 family protein [Syntrophothermus sp.]HHV77179.1 hypothetical protein [Syntrophothermus lipocalidus]HOV42335.1 ribosomal L7Ae/L30e/S12e/Gadd45 family protein [Syntrophothermus lipocalidus]